MVPSPEVFYNDVWNSVDGCTWNRVTDSAPWPARGTIGHSSVFRNRIWPGSGASPNVGCSLTKESSSLVVTSSQNGVPVLLNSSVVPHRRSTAGT